MSDVETISKLVTKIKFLKKEKKTEIKSMLLSKNKVNIFLSHNWDLLLYFALLLLFFWLLFFLIWIFVHCVWDLDQVLHPCNYPCPSHFFFYHFYTLIFTLFIYFYFNGWDLKFLFSTLNLSPSQLLHQVQYLISIIVFV